MKRAALVVMLALLLALTVPVFAQEFPDVPVDHWAYDAIQELVDAGIIQGYPDGTFGGKRALTRYEFAEALAKAVDVIAERVGGGGIGEPGQQGEPGEPGPAGPPGPPGPAGISPEQLQALQRAITEFQDDLAALGVDVDALKRDVAALAERVAAVEAEQARVRLTGSASLMARGTVANDGDVFDRDARGPFVDTDNPIETAEVFTEFDLGIKGRVSDTASVTALISAGDYLQNYAVPGVDDFTLWNMYMDGALDLGFLGTTNVVVGRFPFQLNPFTLKLVDPDSYFFSEKLDSGDFPIDGGRATLNLGPVDLTAFAAKTAPLAPQVTPTLLLGEGVPVDQIGGGRLVVGTPFRGTLGLTYYQAALPAPARAEIFGADFSTSFGTIGLSADWAQTEPNDALEDAALTATPLGEDNTAWQGMLSWQPGRLGVAGGYILVEPNFFAPGYWMRMGEAVNLTNVKGPVANLNYALGSRLSLSAEGKFLEPETDGLRVGGRLAVEPGDVLFPFDFIGGYEPYQEIGLDKINYWRAGIKYGLTSVNTVDLGWEEVLWKPVSGDDTKERYISIGLGHSFSQNASMKLLYQIIDYKQGALSPYGDEDDFRGAVAAAQFQMKF